MFSVFADNPPVAGCTVSKEIHVNPPVICYSLAENTDISAEMYPYRKFIIMCGGTARIYSPDKTAAVTAGSGIITPTDIPVGVKTETGAVYTEILLRSDSIMNKTVKIGDPFKLSSLIPYAKGKIVNMDITHNDKMKFALMAFDAGTGLSEHSAPGEALIFALDGEGIIGYEGKEHKIKKGENFCFAKGGKHYVKAETKFKMALLLTLE